MPTNNPPSAVDWPDARRWADRSKIPPYFIMTMYGGMAVAGIIILAIQGRAAELLSGGFLFLIGWAVFACLISWWAVNTIARARRYVRNG